MRRFPPERIVCLTEETVETLYLLGKENRIVSVSGYAVRPPRVSAFTSADTTKILALAPDLVLAFSDLQAGIVQNLARAGLAVHRFNQRDVAGILAMIRTLGALIDHLAAANTLADSLARPLDAIARQQQHRSPRPRVFFGRAADRRDRLGFRADRDRRRQRRLPPSSRGRGGPGPDRSPRTLSRRPART